ncbi:MAG: hypothetical protein J7623_16085 [Chitinophaga sp.]|uniref:hypothetical protein n=1 Tax=Chitinophaga sp. TaxID=1869181 RepID=UPI001B04CB98|nr:hypothetical protein [Chitinophaga sp.]MBO9730159.1 hypothetical protein [Chitinophaga sp.]
MTQNIIATFLILAVILAIFGVCYFLSRKMYRAFEPKGRKTAIAAAFITFILCIAIILGILIYITERQLALERA